PGLISSLIATVSSVPTGKDFTAHLGSAMKLFDFMSKIPSLASILAQGGKGGEKIDSNAVMESIASVRTMLGRLVSDYGKQPLKEIVDMLNNPVFADLGKAGNKAIKTSEAMNKLISG